MPYPKSSESLTRRRRRYHYKQKFGLSLEEYELMLACQEGVCALCRQTCSSGRNLAVDHDHVTGRVRGLLCFRCNLAMERIDVEPNWIKRADLYLRTV
jgi:hypothetical protein